MKNNNNKKIFALIGLITVAVVIVLAVFMARQRQDIRQRAAAGDAVTFTVNPATLPAGAGTADFDATLILQGNGINISGVDVTIVSSDTNKLVIGRFTPSSAFTTVSGSTRTSETQMRYVGLNMSIPPVPVAGSGPSGEITLGTLRLRNIGSGGGSLSVNSASKVTSGKRLLSITNTSPLATYTVAAAATSTPVTVSAPPSVASVICEYSAGSPSATNFRINGSNFGNGIGDGSTRHVYLYNGFARVRSASLGQIMGCTGWTNNCISGQFFPPLPSGTNNLRIDIDGTGLTTSCNSGTPAPTAAPVQQQQFQQQQQQIPQ